MSLVEYSSSGSSEVTDSEETDINNNRHRGSRGDRDTTPQSTLPPLPDTFHDLYASTSRVSKQDDPYLHDGRQRTTPHIEGNWPTHVYIEWYPPTEQARLINNLLASILDACSSETSQVHSLLKSELGSELPLHISLSRPISLLTDQRQPFIEALAEQVNNCRLKSFESSVSGYDWTANHEKTRWFLVMRLGRAPQDGLNQLLRASNIVAQRFGQRPLYADSQSSHAAYSRYPYSHKKPRTDASKPGLLSSPGSWSPKEGTYCADASASFHVSVGWTLSSPSESLSKKLEIASHAFQAITIPVKSVKAKIGNSVTSIPLVSKMDTANKIIEK